MIERLDEEAFCQGTRPDSRRRKGDGAYNGKRQRDERIGKE